MLLSIAIGLSALALLALVVNPVWGIPLLFIVKPVIDAAFEYPVFYGLRLPEIVAGTVPLVMIGHMLLAAPKQSVRYMPLRWIWTAYLLDALIFSILLAFNEDPKTGFNSFFRYLNGFVGFYMVQAFFQNERDFKRLLAAFMVAGLFPAATAYYQIATGIGWREEFSEGVQRAVGLWHDSVSMREYAFQTILAILLYGVLYLRGNAFKQAVLMGYLVVMVGVVLNVFSKAGTAGLVLWAACWTLLSRKYLQFVMLAGGAVLVAVVASGYLMNLRQVFHKEIGLVTGKGDLAHTLAGRWYGWTHMVDVWFTFPWPAKLFGSGHLAIGAHNDYLQMLYHGGLLGLAIYLCLLGAIGFRVVANLRRRMDPMAIAALMLFLVWLVDTIGVVPSAFPAWQWFVWGVIGLSLRREELALAALPSRSEAIAPLTAGALSGEGRRPVSPPGTVERRFPIVFP